MLTMVQCYESCTVMTFRALSSNGLYLFPERQQSVKIGDVLSQWVMLCGGMPQGSWLGPLVFLILTDDLQLQTLTHKYVDDTTISEVVMKDESSQMQSVVDELMNWSGAIYRNINGKKDQGDDLGSFA